MARSLDQILQEIDAGYNPQRQSIQTRLDALPAQADAEIAGLKATQEQAFGDILGGARDRGMGFSGQPLAEQSRYTASQFLPAVARVRQSQNESKQGLFDALNNINLQKNQFGQQLYQTEQDRAEQARQFDAQQRAASAQQSSLAGLFNQQQKAPQQQAPLGVPGASFKDQSKGGAGGFNFSFGGKPISAIGLAQVNNLNPADIIYSMASSGDRYAADAYREIIANGGNITPQLAQKYNALFWGTNMLPAQAKAQSKSPAPKVDTNIYPNANKVPGFLGINR